MIKKEDGLIDWSEPAEKIERKIRAFNPWPGTYTKINGKIFKIFSAEAKNDKLKLAEVQLEGKKRMSFDDFRRGFKKKLDFSDRIS
jgi:methionyl-tRNA formyltransferase